MLHFTGRLNFVGGATSVELVQYGCSSCGLRQPVSDVVLMAVMTVLLADLVLALLLFAIFDRLRVKMMVSAIAWHYALLVLLSASAVFVLVVMVLSVMSVGCKNCWQKCRLFGVAGGDGVDGGWVGCINKMARK